MSGTLNMFDRKSPPPTCFECDHVAEHRHHVVPRSMGGTRTVWLCTKCHAAAHHFEKDPWMHHKRLQREGIRKRIERGEEWAPYAKVLAKQNRERADQIALDLAPLFERLNDKGLTTLMEKVHELNRIGHPTPTGKGRWHISTVHRYTKRLERMEQELARKRAA